MTEQKLIGSTLGRFEILRELGRGGMAVVYQARQTDLDRVVALKVLPPALTHDAAYVARFRQEARSAARLEHPHIMPIYEVGEAGGLHYIAMKYIAGQTVKDLVEREGALSVQRAATILAQVGDALDHAHKQGVIHRDIKPSNMMITEEGWVYLTDFGLARGTGGTEGLTMAGTVMGTPEYMSPEQAQGLPSVGPATDIYALGVVLFELLTGTFPFKADTPMGMLAARLLQAPTPPRDIRGDVPAAVEDVVMRALARKPEARFPTAAALVAALRAAAGIGSAEPPRPQTPVAGVPALGATIQVPAPTSPPPPARAPMAPTTAAPALPTDVTHAVSLPRQAVAPGLSPGQLPAGPPQAAGAAPARRGPSNLMVILAAVSVTILACIGLAATLALRGGQTSTITTSPTTVVGEDLEALLARADASLASQDGLTPAIKAYRAILSGQPDNAQVIERLALAYNAGGDWANAEEFANQLIDVAANPTQVALGYALLADAYASQGDMTAAMAEIGKATENDPELPLGHAIESNLLSTRALAAGSESEMEAALASLDRAVDTLEGAAPVVEALTRNALGYTFSEQYQLSDSAEALEQSIEQYEEAITLLPSAGLFSSNLAYVLMSDEEYDAARDSFAEALEAGYLPAHAGIGWSYYNEDELDKAEEAFAEAMAQDPDGPDGYLGMGRLRYDEAAYDEAIALFSQAAERNPRSPEIQNWLGEALFWQGFNSEGEPATAAFERAIEAYSQALARNDRSTFALSGLAWTYQHLESYAESVSRFDQVIALESYNAVHYNGKGWSLFNWGQHAEAEAAFRQAVAIDDSYSEAHYHLGRALEAQGRTDEARAAYQRALELDPENESIQEYLDGLGG